ncbi:Coenzyme F420 hydrogenase/dehydrogenase, beta subunit C-terminal domain [uncultured Dialister sp.]|uniref:Coenzyme F420 hydrogenase/dehydrogenase, beta subunit C-terminal domain n=1 Tax=uncultured Dialister sp. TaxID=278064 RepID=UPI0025E06F31|nr:Coenzyme F420 hydrogenase/dehydrogenase, beta subunit C-terminal domain [uncultured Dialister sp.]
MKKTVCDDFEKQNCCGCGACINICPVGALSYGKDDMGFTIPCIDEKKCIHCGACSSICPILNKEDQSIFHSPLEAWALRNKNDDDQFHSASGGVFIALAKEMIRQGGVVAGCIMDENFKVRHVIVDNLEDIPAMQKSKYLQSDMGQIYREVKRNLLKRIPVLFSGTPCEVAALKRFLKRIDTKNLYLVDLVCHGVPSQTFFDDYLVSMQKKNGNLIQYTFRAKHDAHENMNYFISMEFKGSSKRICYWAEDSYNYFFQMGANYRESCYTCPFAQTKRTSDITICDYWGWSQYHKGDFPLEVYVSGTLTNTEKGKLMIEKIRENFHIVATGINDIVSNNGCLRRPTPRPANRDKILSIWRDKGYDELENRFQQKYKWIIRKHWLMRLLPDSLIYRVHTWRKRNGH